MEPSISELCHSITETLERMNEAAKQEAKEIHELVQQMEALDEIR